MDDEKRFQLVTPIRICSHGNAHSGFVFLHTLHLSGSDGPVRRHTVEKTSLIHIVDILQFEAR